MIKRVFKFGGASVKDADAVRNLKHILENEDRSDLMLVISAMGKTTNGIEKVLKEFRDADGHLPIDAMRDLMNYHEKIMLELFNDNSEHPVFEAVTNLFLDLYLNLQETGYDYDYQYDQTIRFLIICASAYYLECDKVHKKEDSSETNLILNIHNHHIPNSG